MSDDPPREHDPIGRKGLIGESCSESQESKRVLIEKAVSTFSERALGAAPGKPLTPAARRALEEAAARRAAEEGKPKAPKEVGGAGGPDPTRFGDWEHKGRATDF